MPSAKWTRAVILLAAGVWFVIAFFLHVPVDRLWAKYVGASASVVIWLLLAFDKFAWRFLPAWLVKRPVVRGTWKAVLRSSHKEADGRPVERECFIVIRQTYSTLSVEMFFDRSYSKSTTANIVRDVGRPLLSYVYDSEAHALEQDGNPPHRGAAKLYIASGKPKCLEGDYWTMRLTKGQIETAGHSRHLAESYAAARKLNYG